MELNAADRLTAIEMVRRTKEPYPNRIIECITQTNQILLDMPFAECNNGTFHTIVRRTKLAEASVRSYYQGTRTVATQTAAVEEPTGMYQAIVELDGDLLEHGGSAEAVQKTESVGVLNGMGIQQARNFVYGRRTPQAKNGVDGFATRLSKVDGVAVVDMGGTGNDLTSVYLAALGDTYLHGIYPKGFGTAGVKAEPEGKVTLTDADGGKYQGYRTYYKCQYGIALEHPGSLIRLANIPADLDPERLVDEILSRGRRLPDGAPTYALYANYTALNILDRAAYKKPNVIFSTEDPWSRPMTMLRNFRIRTVEAILDTEERVA